MSASSIPKITMIELKSKVDHLGSEEVVLDVRGPDEYRAGHIAGSLNIPHDQVQNHLEELKKYKTIYVHCHAGKRAEMASQVLAKAGLKNVVCVANSGMKDWLSAGFPTVK
jgi:hydroxyacylglutathione hydrolase